MVSVLRGIEGSLISRLGLNMDSVGSQLVVRAVKHRMAELGLRSLDRYECTLRESESELQALIDEVVVPESWFFRDDAPFEFIREYVRANWLAQTSRGPLRVLSLGCAGGEEPYSVSMTFCDLGLARSRFQIDAVDVSARRLALARQGIYSANAFRGSARGYQARYFRGQARGYEIDPSVRATVRFLQANVLEPRLLEDVVPYDILFCRNVLIYLEPTARASLTATLNRLLRDDGVLVIGHADRVEWVGEPPRFTAIGPPGCFAYGKSAGVGPIGDRLQSESPLVAVACPGTDAVASQFASTVPELGVADVLASRSTRSVGPSPARDNTTGLLEQAGYLANEGRHPEALATCERLLKSKGPNAAVYHLMGMIHQATGAYARAEECFHRAVYLDPRHDEALLALALLAERAGDRRLAEGLRRRAQRIFATASKKAT
jgi:chemotaxis protein methyltransferase WspC